MFCFCFSTLHIQLGPLFCRLCHAVRVLTSDQATARASRRQCLAKPYGGRIPHRISCVTVFLGHCCEKVVRLGLPNIACTTLTKFNQKCYNSTVFQALCSGTYEVAFSKTWTPTKNVFESLYANMPLMHMPPSGSQTWLSTI